MGSPRETPGSWDTVDLGGTLLPPAGVDGHVTVTVKPKIKDDKKSPSGKNGGRTTTHGLDLAEVEIELEWPDAPGQYDRVAAAMGEIWPPKSAKAISHEAAALWGVRDIEVRSVQGPEWKDGKGTIKISCREWHQDPPTAPSATKTNDSSDPGKQWMQSPHTLVPLGEIQPTTPAIPTGEVQP